MGNFPILLAEDSQDDVLFFERAFKRVEISNSLQVVRDGEQAIAYLAGEGDFSDSRKYPLPGLVVLDLKLPKKSGWEVLQWIRNSLNVQTVPVIVLSSSSSDSDKHEAYRLGASSYLVKPKDLNGWTDLLKVLKEYWVIRNEPPPQIMNLLGYGTGRTGG